MSEKVIYTKKGNCFQLGLIILAMIIIVVLMAVLQDETIVVKLISGTLICISLFYLCMQLYGKVKRPNMGLELSKEGFLFQASPLGRKKGRIQWKDVQAIQSGATEGKKRLLIKLTPNERLIIDSKSLNANFYEIETAVLYYYHQYHNHQPSIHKTDN